MTAKAIVAPNEEESYLVALLDSIDGIDLAEAFWSDPSTATGCFRVWDFQWKWFTCTDTLQADQCGRGVGKCLAPDTRLTLADGRRIRVADLAAATDPTAILATVARADDAVHGFELRPGTVYVSGHKACLRIRTVSGRILTVSTDHPVFTSTGWRKAGELAGDDSLAIAAYQPVFGRKVLPRYLVRLLAHVIATGGVGDRPRDVWYSSADAGTDTSYYDDLDATLGAAKLVARPVSRRDRMIKIVGERCGPGNGIGPFMAQAGMTGARAGTMRIPDLVFALPARQLALFLGRLLQPPHGVAVRAGTVRYQCANPAMAADLAHLLTRFGVTSRIRSKLLPSMRGRTRTDARIQVVTIDDPASLVRFAAVVGPHVLGGTRTALDALVAGLDPAAFTAAAAPPVVVFDSVADITDAGEQDVYDVTMSGEPQLFADDVLVHNSTKIIMRGFAHPFHAPGEHMFITAPELNHLGPLTDGLQNRFEGTRIGAEMMTKGRGGGITKQPHWQAQFLNGAKIITRLPNRDGRGVKSQHASKLHLDEAQDYPAAGWNEVQPTFKRGVPGAQWHVHGVPRGVRDNFYAITSDESKFTVHRYFACHRPDWSDNERAEAIRNYGGSPRDPDYKRNIFGDHGDATNPLFVLSRFIAVCDLDPGSDYNTAVYAARSLSDELLADHDLDALLDLPAIHRIGYSRAPRGYSAYYGGMDVGMTNHPSEVLIFGQRTGTELMELLLRVHMERVDTERQVMVVQRLFDFYGSKLIAFALDRTGIGHSVWDLLDKSYVGDRVYGYHFSSKVPVGIREAAEGEDPHDLDALIEMRDLVEHASDVLRVDWVDAGRLQLPADDELLGEWQGQTYKVEKSGGNLYGKRVYSKGKMHTLDAGKMAAAAKTLPPIQDAIDRARAVHDVDPVFDEFLGSSW